MIFKKNKIIIKNIVIIIKLNNLFIIISFLINSSIKLILFKIKLKI